MKKVSLLMLSCYSKHISPFLPPHCRFYPTCSAYTKQAIDKYGFVQGGALGIKRLLKCHPWHEGGIDHVPEPDESPCNH
ncbi:MAG: membrane protein insertion efficiency factor YidD [Pseudomonadales bacterium]|nr:membrane protein insertion efficiency factor YidD [Pseudomonadales bacterium]